MLAERNEELRVDEPLGKAVGWLRDHQDPEGWWTDELETNVTMTAEHVLLLTFLGVSVDPIREQAIHQILVNQRSDGSWGLYYAAAADLSTTIEAYVALKVLGVDPSSDPMHRALRVIQQQGGIVNARVFTKIWMALFGEYPWQGIPSMPPELVHLPPTIPFNLYDFACWARGTIAPLLIVLSHRPVRALGTSVTEIVLPGTEDRMTIVPGSGPFWWSDKLLKLYDALPRQPGRPRSRKQLVEWILERQEADGSWGGIQPPWVYSMIALHVEGMSVDHPVMQKAFEGLNDFSLEDPANGWRLQACMSPVWDTAWTMQALRWAGLERSDPMLRSSVAWILREQIEGGGDWQVRAPNVPCGGWAFEFENDTYPDIDDTAVVGVSLLDAQLPGEACVAIEKATNWLVAMQSSNGAWGAFDRDNTRQLVYKLPFADFGAMLDPPSEDVTAHVLELLARLGRPLSDPVVARGLAYLRETQRPDGSWWGRWGVNFIYGTWCVIAALSAFNSPSLEDMIRRGMDWFIERQNADGGWGETCYSYEDESFAGVGVSTPSQTAWAVISLQLAGLRDHSAVQRGLTFLRDRQNADGTWPEREYTGTGFPRDFYLNYHLYRHLFPTMALAAARPGWTRGG